MSPDVIDPVRKFRGKFNNIMFAVGRSSHT